MSFCAKFSEDIRSSCQIFNEKSAPLRHIRWLYGLIEALSHGAVNGNEKCTRNGKIKVYRPGVH
jgi:hypothetical protein